MTALVDLESQIESMVGKNMQQLFLASPLLVTGLSTAGSAKTILGPLGTKGFGFFIQELFVMISVVEFGSNGEGK